MEPLRSAALDRTCCAVWHAECWGPHSAVLPAAMLQCDRQLANNAAQLPLGSVYDIPLMVSNRRALMSIPIQEVCINGLF